MEWSGGGTGAKKAVTKACAFFVGPIDEFQSDRRLRCGGVTAHGFESGDDTECAIEPTSVRNGIDVTADDDGFVGCAWESGKKISGGIGGELEIQRREFAAEPFAGGAPDGAPGDALRAVGSGGECGEFAE